MLLNLVLLLAGLALLTWSADRFIAAAASLVRHWGVSPMLIGIFVLGVGTSARFEVRGQMLRRLLAGEEMGPVVDALSGQRDVKKSGGMMGEITNGNLKRNDCYAHGVLFAFAPFVSPRAYWDEA